MSTIDKPADIVVREIPHGSRLGTKLRRFCDGTKFRYVFY